MNKDLLTTLSGVISGLCLVLGNVFPEFKGIADALAGLGIAVVAYFVAKKVA